MIPLSARQYISERNQYKRWWAQQFVLAALDRGETVMVCCPGGNQLWMPR